MKRTTADTAAIRMTGESEDIAVHASLTSTEPSNPSSCLLPNCSQRPMYGSGWSSASPTQCKTCGGTREQISLQGPRLDTLAAEKRNDVKKKQSQRSKSVDAGWAWVVLLAAIYITLFMINTTPCFGILFSQKMFQLVASSTDVSIIYSTHLFMRMFGVIITNSLVNKFGHRNVAFLSCFMGSASMMMLAFSPSLSSVFIYYSIIHGMNAGIGSTVGFMIVSQYFERRRGFAMALLMTGIAVGGVVFPMLVRCLQDEFGFFGGVLLLGAIISNCCVAALLFRPPPLSNKSEPNEDSLLLNDTQKNTATNKSNTLTNTIQLFSSGCKNFSKWFKRALGVLQQFRVLLIGLSVATMQVGYYNFLMLVPFSVESSGKSSAVSAWYVLAYALTNTGSRILMTGLADRTWISKRVVMVFGALLASQSVIAFVLLSSDQLLITSMLFFGVGIGAYWSVYHAHMIEVLGLDLFKEAYGFNSVWIAVVFATTGPTLGVIRDWSGSYSWSIIPCAGHLLLSAILLLPLPLAAAKDQKMWEQNCK